MFCPNAADWGNVADWISGLGTLIAVGAAIWIAGTEQRSVVRQRKIDENVAFEKRSHVKAEAIRLIGQAEAIALAHLAILKAESVGSYTTIKEFVYGIEGIRAQLISLQHFPIADPRLFSEIGRTAHELAFEPDMFQKSPTYAKFVSNQVSDRMKLRRDAIGPI